MPGYVPSHIYHIDFDVVIFVSFFVRKSYLIYKNIEMKLFSFLFILTLSLQSFSQDKPAYNVFTGKGKKADYGDIIKEISKSDIVFFGELHDDPIAHWLEVELTKSLLAEKGKNLVIGAEMFESDNQLLIDEYLDNVYDASKFEAEVKLWKNYKTDYKPLVDIAKTNRIQFVATNVPRRYAAVVSKKGFEGLDSLSSEAKKYIAPLPFPYDPEVKCYKDMLKMSGMGGDSTSHVSPNFPKAQAVKDATMAHFILENWSKGKLFIHFNGSYHSSNFEGILWYLKKSDPNLEISTIETVQQDKIGTLEKENNNIATFVIAIPSSMTRTYK
jgi:uncharacterized iron-regulated protein